MIALFGAPGSGKTVQGQLLAKQLGWGWVSSRNLLASLKDRDITLALSHGMPIDNDKNLLALEYALKPMIATNNWNVILDDFPNSVSQIYWMTEKDLLKNLKCAIVLRVPRGELWKRLLERGRIDDTRAAVERRQDLYERSVTGMIHVLRENGIPVIEVDGCNSPKDVLERILEKLNELHH